MVISVLSVRFSVIYVYNLCCAAHGMYLIFETLPIKMPKTVFNAVEDEMLPKKVGKSRVLYDSPHNKLS